MRESTTRTTSGTLVSVTPLRSGALEEIHVSAVPEVPADDAATQTKSMYAAIANELEDPQSLVTVVERVFGRLEAKEEFLTARAEALLAAGLPTDSPVTYLEGPPVKGNALAGVQLTLVRSGDDRVEVNPLGNGHGKYGYVVSSDGITRVFLPGMLGGDARHVPTCPRDEASRMLRKTRELLNSAGMTYRNVVLTRIYLRRLLDWYDDLNVARNEFYDEIGFTDSPIPASTGIQGKISDVNECFMDVTAVQKGGPDECPFVTLRNPLQNEATAYGSGFARAVRIDVPDAHYVLVSGTASIDETGATVHVDDPVKQTGRTMDNFEAIVKVGDAELSNLYHAVWYCKDPSYASVIKDEMRKRGWPEFPYVVVVADVCRDDLLVEIDGAAVVNSK